ncbi:uncharacterized protein THITE_2119173 [Thermothielavioides terrestris NRRL 8126]|uniref:Glutamyl/glutaminyl-tRNA synthetase class Ib catalytic domain-containing protein n=1 Tax=Thermothielavioides terrestris (strain ATCC 38088 / NRRL 8126) TaxID=578455 RepID=G2RBF6_THETT|nr:uncharacterized protein THITE_2119173 [Thermothielavioides terrestris NRRL 8126]AEO69127.1 hypothetical protein THITE_2119173 [Thermothielavioides terrestris NRRL 8126]
METAVLRGRGLSGRPLYSAFACRWSWRPHSRPYSRHRSRPLPYPEISPAKGDMLDLYEKASLDVYDIRKRLWPNKRQARLQMPSKPCRTRFAPSPTGYLHLGSLRTALFNYLFARATCGQFVLRIEDTDQKRLVPDAEQRLYEDLRWAGLSWDEGPDLETSNGPYRQSERLHIYKEHAELLLSQGKAYKCFCPPETSKQNETAASETSEQNETAASETPQPIREPCSCRFMTPRELDDRARNGEQFAIRFLSARRPVWIEDLVYGSFSCQHPSDDFIILKRDGFPTYHLANVVDDRLMKITHVIRGAVCRPVFLPPVSESNRLTVSSLQTGVAHLNTKAR